MPLRPHALFALVLCLPLSALANPVEVPHSTDFEGEVDDFWAPTGNGYNWGHDWRLGKYVSWVSTSSKTVTASMQARALDGRDFYLKVTVDPVSLSGSGHSVGFGACGNSLTYGSYYLADVKPAINAIRIVRISGGNTFIVPEQTIQNLSLTDLEPFDLELVGNYTGNHLFLNFTVRKGGQSFTVTADESGARTGSHYGLRARTGSGSFEFHFDDYELGHLNPETPTPVPPAFAPVGEFFDHVGDGTPPASIPPWSDIYPSGGFFGTPAAGDTGVYTLDYPGGIEPYRAALSATVTVPAPSEVIISEFMADNDDTLDDEDGESSDWLELFNPTSNPVDLTGWQLTDDPSHATAWPIPAGTVLPPFGFQVVFASGKTTPGHANFKIGDGAGGYLALLRPDDSVASEFSSYPKQREDISFGAYGDYAMTGYLTEPTPGAANPPVGYSGFVADTSFSVKRGFFDAPFSVDVSCPTPGATIVYTTDGSTPTLSNGTSSVSPATVSISETTVLRAAAFASGLVPANVDTQTYLYLDDVKSQDSAHAHAGGWPSGSVNGQVFSYGMDPDIVGPLSDEEFEAAMTDIPSISLVTDIDNFVDPLTGFWVNAENRGRDWERPVSVELINPDTTPGFQIDAGVRLRGGWSRQGSNPKHSFHLYFRSEYGTGKLDYPLFGDEGAKTFDALDLRASQGRSWHWSNTSDATFNRDVFGRDCQRDMGQPYSRSRYYHLYINGQYFGLFQSQERVDRNYAASYFGGEPDGYDVIKTRTRPHRVEALDGYPGAWSRLFDAAVAGFASDADYYAVQGLDASGVPDPAEENLVDVDNLIDYMLAIFYTGQNDGPVNLGANVPKNFFCVRARDGSFGFRFFVHDNEDSFQSVTKDATVSNPTGDRLTYFNPKWLHQRLMANPNYLRRFADRAHRHLFNGGALTTAECQARFRATSDMLTNAIIGESARWGDFRVSTPYDQADWQNAVNSKITSWIPQRGAILLGQLRSRGLYPGSDAPTFSQHGGQVAAGFDLSITAPAGTIYYTTDGADPDGPGGQVLGGDVTIAANTHVKARALDGGEWSALTEAAFYTTVAATAGNLAISEIYYNPPGSSEATEYLELQNISPSDTIHLDGLQFTGGISFAFPDGLTLAPGERIVLVKDQPAFEAAFGMGLPVAGVYSGSLDNKGEELRIEGLFAFEYGDDFPWSELADGAGRSLVYLGGAPGEAGSWRASAADGGSPGGGDSTTFPGGDFESYAFGDIEPEVLAGGRFGFPQNLAADDVEYILEASETLQNWGEPSGWVKTGEISLGGPWVQVIWEPAAMGARGFLRLRAVIANAD